MQMPQLTLSVLAEFVTVEVAVTSEGKHGQVDVASMSGAAA